MGLGLPELLVGQLAGLEQDRGWDPDLAQIVQGRRQAEPRQALFGELELSAQDLGVETHAAHVSRRLGVCVLGCSGQGAHRLPELEALAREGLGGVEGDPGLGGEGAGHVFVLAGDGRSAQDQERDHAGRVLAAAPKHGDQGSRSALGPEGQVAAGLEGGLGRAVDLRGEEDAVADGGVALERARVEGVARLEGALALLGRDRGGRVEGAEDEVRPFEEVEAGLGAAEGLGRLARHSLLDRFWSPASDQEVGAPQDPQVLDEGVLAGQSRLNRGRGVASRTRRSRRPR